MPLTITEALAEIKTLNKRIEKKRQFIAQYIGRQEAAKDPLEKDGGSVEVHRREQQAILDLENRIVALRCGINRTNDSTSITLTDHTKTIAEWLIWRRDIAPKRKAFLEGTRQAINQVRETARRQGNNVILPGGGSAEKPTDVIINVSESELHKEIETLEQILGDLDGQLSLKNATVLIDV